MVLWWSEKSSLLDSSTSPFVWWLGRRVTVATLHVDIQYMYMYMYMYMHAVCGTWVWLTSYTTCRHTVHVHAVCGGCGSQDDGHAGGVGNDDLALWGVDSCHHDLGLQVRGCG